MTDNYSEQLLDECRELMTTRMRSSLSKLMGNVENILFEMAANDQNDTGGTHYIDAVRELRLKKREIQVRFENRYMGIYNDGIRQLISTVEIKTEPQNIAVSTGDSIHLNTDEINILSEPIENTRSECRLALMVLDRHVNRLFEDAKGERFINPLQPETVFHAFWDSCHDIRCSSEIRIILVRMFERQVVLDLTRTYDDIINLFDYYRQYGQSIQNRYKKRDTGKEKLNPDSQQYFNDSILVKSWVQAKVKGQIQGSELPEFIEEFLMDYWCALLVDIFEKFSMNSLEWERAVHVVDDLIVCTSLTADRQSRIQQIWQFPGLLYRIKAGMKTISLPLKIQARFLSDLKLFHSQLTDLSFNKKN